MLSSLEFKRNYRDKKGSNTRLIEFTPSQEYIVNERTHHPDGPEDENYKPVTSGPAWEEFEAATQILAVEITFMGTCAAAKKDTMVDDIQKWKTKMPFVKQLVVSVAPLYRSVHEQMGGLSEERRAQGNVLLRVVSSLNNVYPSVDKTVDIPQEVLVELVRNKSKANALF